MAKQIPAHILQLPAYLSHKSALVLLPRPSIVAPIERVRRVYDKQYNRWPPHINLLYPFLANPRVRSKQDGGTDFMLKREIHMRIARVVEVEAGAFHHNEKSHSAWLGPATQDIQRLHAEQQTEFFEINHDTRPFTPHLSVGQTRSYIGL
ncbi:hypothetical protein PTT_07466 [Pyrenophora teres f. teres 0-1]|uniref:Uncharacterized protein n=1 Tax=Pyrenophora teres f. teres (strain 0-1) TaxID=861557 RepID=E3RHP7_PYRTT|nr:hypothetical protein PTT_07466 [Pyrenophora teres f. teres 0-1]